MGIKIFTPKSPDKDLLQNPGDNGLAKLAHVNKLVTEINNLALTLHARVATTANITLSGTQTIDGIAVVAKDIVLVKNQSTGANNGVYVASTGAWQRDPHMNSSADFVEGRQVTVADGTANGNSMFQLDSTNPFVLGTTTATFVAISGTAFLASPAFTGTPTAPTAAVNTNTTQIATTAGMLAQLNASKGYLPIAEGSGSITAAETAGTYVVGKGAPLVKSGTGVATPVALAYIDTADYPSIGGVARTMRIRTVLSVNDVAPTGNYTFGLYPVTRPGTSGGTGLNIYTLGTVVTGSTVAYTTPAADSMVVGTSTSFTMPTTGYYVIGVVTTATVATDSHLDINAKLEVVAI